MMKQFLSRITLLILIITSYIALTALACADGVKMGPYIKRDKKPLMPPSIPIKYPTKQMDMYEYCVEKGSRETFKSYIAPTQQAIISHKDGIETLIIEVAPLASPDFAWVVPVPSYPKVEKADAEMFNMLTNSVFYSMFGKFTFVMYNSSQGLAARPDDSEADTKVRQDSPPVIVHERKVVGSFDIAILSADQPNALITWLNDNQYYFPDNGKETIDF